ncbi:MAG: O-methyltransferase [Bacteroidales bacterium]
MNLEYYIEQHIDEEPEHLRELTRATNLETLHSRMLSGHLQGRILSMISKLVAPINILEIGTFTGYSALCLAEGLQKGGRLTSIEINDEIAEFACQAIEKSEYSDNINIVLGDALEVIPKLQYTFQLIFIDANKRDYSSYYDMVFPLLDIGGVIIADNVLWSGKVVRKLDEKDEQTVELLAFNEKVKNDSKVEKVILPVRDGISIIRKISND